MEYMVEGYKGHDIEIERWGDSYCLILDGKEHGLGYDPKAMLEEAKKEVDRK